jgi:hypothetical protein
MAISRRARRCVAVLLGSCILVLPGCFTITLWEHAPRVEVKEVAGAEVDASHVLAVDVRYTNGTLTRYDYALTGKARDLVPVGRADPPLPSGKFVVVPASPVGSNLEGDRFSAGSVLEITYARFGGLEVRQVRPQGSVERQFVPDGGPDWSAPSNYGRALLTVPAVALDVVTSPIQLGFLCWVLVAHPSM